VPGQRHADGGERVGVLTVPEDAAEAARALYATLRALDAAVNGITRSCGGALAPFLVGGPAEAPADRPDPAGVPASSGPAPRDDGGPGVAALQDRLDVLEDQLSLGVLRVMTGEAVGLEEGEDVGAELDGLVALGDFDGDGPGLLFLGVGPDAKRGRDARRDLRRAPLPCPWSSVARNSV